MNRSEGTVKECRELRARVADLEARLEEALLAAEDARQEAADLAVERDRVIDSHASRDRAFHEMSHRLGQAEAEVATARERTERKSSVEEDLLAEELRASVEELQVLATELETANADLEQRVEERTAELTAANAALTDSEERLRFAQRCARAGGWDWDATTDHLTWSPEAVALLGLDRRGGGPHDRWSAVFHPDDREATQATVDAARAMGTDDFRMEFRILHPDQGVRWMAGIGRVVERADGRPRRIAGLVVEITQTKRLEESLRQAKDEAERADRAKTHFLAAASHDLRQPIQAAALYTEVLSRHLDNDQGQEVLDLLRASIEGLHGMLNGLLDLSRLEAGVIEPAIVDFVPDELMTRLAAEFQAEAEVAGTELRCLPATVPVTTDPHLLERMLRNLLSNAIKHGAGDTGGRVLLTCRQTGDLAEFQVWDNGPGIAPEHLDSVFEEFRQLKNPERNPVQGFGLGLAIVSRIARLLDLKVEVRSELGSGSIFSVAVPVSVTNEVQAIYSDSPSAEDMARLDGRTAFIIEDDRAVRQALGMLLGEWGLTVVAVADADELGAVLAARDTGPDIVIADHRLPGGVTARTVIEMVRRRWNAPAIIVTGDTAPERLREAKSIGCHLLHKPVEPMELACTLRDAMAEQFDHGPVRRGALG